MKRALFNKYTTKWCNYCDFTKNCRHKKNGCKHYKEYVKKYAKGRNKKRGAE